ncbi:hypothetical protein JZ751_022370 [Albula glossodonta]|uniref:Uncharacterized protein n=1 Tax=Albula glossodonta TaxID=121402 RepID=A0A8T2NHH4_9TELE|nr:hypothetical protein JZ751_022370 [Albula glossodonta]
MPRTSPRQRQWQQRGAWWKGDPSVKPTQTPPPPPPPPPPPTPPPPLLGLVTVGRSHTEPVVVETGGSDTAATAANQR